MNRRRIARMMVSLAALAAARSVCAQTISWNLSVGSGNWNVAPNWNPQTIPQSGVSVSLAQSDGTDRNVNFISPTPTALSALTIDATGSGRITLTQSQDTLGAATMTLGSSSGAVGLFNLSGGTLAAGAQIIGSSGVGTLTHSAGRNQSTGFLSVGDATNGIGTYLLSSTGVVNIPEIYVGYSGTGTFAQTGGQILGTPNSFLALGYNTNSNGTVTISGGTIGVQIGYVGEFGNGTIVQNGGAINLPQYLSIGDGSTGKGTYRLTTGSFSANELDVGYSGNGSFIQNGGAANISGPLFVAVNAGSKGTFTISSGSFVAQSTSVGAAGSINFNGGALSLGALSVNGGIVRASIGGGKQLIASSVALSGAGAIDLGDNDMIVKGGNSYTDIATLISAARNGGSWNGVGITSTAAKNDPNSIRTLGVMQGSDYRGLQPDRTTFDGTPVDNADVLVRFTYYGDANFNGKIDGGDYARIDTAFNNEATRGNIGGWINGDFDGNGRVDGADYAIIDRAFALQNGTIGNPVGHSIPGAIPEPSSSTILSSLTCCLLLRIRRKPRSNNGL